MGGGGGVLTPAAGRATQHLPGPRVVDGILPTGRVLLVGGFVLGARHDDFYLFCFVLLVFFFPDRDLRKLAASSIPPQKNRRKKRAADAMWRGEEAGEAAASGVGGGGREREKKGERENKTR